MSASPPPDAAALAAAAVASSPFSSSASAVPLGIDLGHSYACVGVWRNGNVDIIANDLGSRSTPVLLSFTDKEVLFGEAAQSQLAVNLKATVHHAKRLLGLPYAHPTVAQLKAHVDYTIVPSHGEDGVASHPLIQLAYKGEEKRFRSEELLGMMLARLKGIADRYSGSDCRECVLAVPSFFTEGQRAALVSAGQQAGLTVLTVLNEATAAALAFGLDVAQPSKGGKTKENIAVVDVGGATTTVTILQSEAGFLTQKSVMSDQHLGGDDFDEVLVSHFTKEFSRTYKLQLESSHRALARLSFAVEKAKRVLSSSTSASIELDGLYEGEDFYSKVSRAKFEALAAPLLKRLTALMKAALQHSNLSAGMIDHVCLIGGSSRVPRVADLVKQVMGREPKKNVNPEEAVAVGCTIQASLLLGRAKEWETAVHSELSEKKGEIALARSIGVEGDDGVVQRVLSKGTTVPTHATFALAAHRPSSSSSSSPFLLRVFEGERALTRDSQPLATLVIPGRISTPITASLTVDKARKLHVRAYTGKVVHAEITVDPSLPSPPERTIDASDATEALDSLYLEKSASRRALYDLLLTLREPRAVVDAAWAWLHSAQVGTSGEEKEDEFERKRAEVEEAVDAWKQSGSSATPASTDIDDVDDYIANMSLSDQRGETSRADKASSAAADDFDHEIADLD